jgi:hypothetical protein
MNKEELNEFLGKKVEITLYGTDVTGILNQASDECFEKFSIVGDIWYLLIEETPMLVDCSNFTYKEFANGKLYFCPKCCNMITKSYCYCPTCGQRLLWVNIYDTRATVKDNENVKKGE